ncbi:MAG: hypothetical protein MJ252_05640, partial [archaeon]|nr:hypothetical protein [archaeon]
MGIPKFARYLMTKYPLIIRKIMNDNDLPSIDYLYLDINGIIHNVSHGNNIFKSLSYKDDTTIYSATCQVIDAILKLIKPKKMMMISVDGVAPRA